MTITRCAALLFVTAAGLQPALASQPPPDSVELDVVVSGISPREAGSLTAADFEVVDAGNVRPVIRASIPKQDGRVLAIFLDEFHVQPGDATARVREAATRFVSTHLRDGDAIAVMKPLDPLAAISLTKDRAAILSAIATFEGRKGDYSPRSAFEEKFMSRDPRTADISRAQVVTSAMQALASRLGEQGSGRKALILLSEGFAPAHPRTITHAANRHGVAIHAIDPHPDPAGHDAILRSLSEQTGGEPSLNQSDLIPALSRAVADLDAYYLLSYPSSGADGKFHAVHVRVKRPGAQARARAGYWSPNPPAVSSSNVTATMLLTARPAHSSPFIRPWIGMSRGAEGRTQVTVTWEPGAPPPRHQRVASVSLKAIGADGAELVHKRVSAGEPTRVAFDTTPGYVSLEMTIYSSSGAVLDTDFRGVTVPDLKVKRPTLATPQIMRTRTARGFAALSADANAIPVASRSFSRTERLLVRVPVYTVGDVPPVVTATLLNRRGTAMRALEQVPGDLPAGIVQFDLPLASLAPGQYQVQLTAANVHGARDEARELVVLSVTH